MKHLNLAKKIKALAERGIGGEKINAEKILNDLLKRHNISISDIENITTEDYYFNLEKIGFDLFVQVAKRVRHSIPVYGEFDRITIKEYSLKGNFCITCTCAEYVEIDAMYYHYLNLYKNELNVFFHAFLTANDLLTKVPENERRSFEDLTQEEKELYVRKEIMARQIKSETFRKRLKSEK